jgi:hypothetical protein
MRGTHRISRVGRHTKIVSPEVPAVPPNAHAMHIIDREHEDVIQVSRTEAGEWTTRVLQDPAGNEFCVIGPD